KALSPINQVDALEVATREVSIHGLHQDMDGFRILFLTDFHVHPTLSEEYFGKIVEESLSLRPDLLLVGGDFVSRRWHLPLACRLLRPLWLHSAVYYVRGNHDFWTRPSYMVRELQRHGAQLLSNDHTKITRGEGAFTLVGIEDPYIQLTPREKRRLLDSMPEALPRIGLVHTPEAYPFTRQLGCEFTLAGHTHGGQIRLPFFGTTVASVSQREEFLHGIGKMSEMTTWTSNGLGAFYPLRVNCPPQIVEVVLRSV
ncbi:MAG: metallophosphoesterase, partial [Candidatus Sumerlaeia bacterium]|nr:metallophosphoesterase [Candidatus Sumerlaeia bacterium]